VKPTERAYALAKICMQRGERLPLALLDEAKRLSISLASYVTHAEETKPNKPKIETKESPNGSSN
jgi:hypothetical protein